MAGIVVINGSPRKGWNTAMLVNEAADGAREAGAEVLAFDLYKLERFTGCVSCFGCKRERSLGRCIYKDGLTPVLDAIRESDGVIIGSPNYLGDITAVTRSLFERLIFQLISYKQNPPNYVERDIPVLFIMTSNCAEERYRDMGYDKMIEGYQRQLTTFLGPTRVLVAGNTLQVKDYAPFDWTMFDPEAKRAWREEDFPRKCAEARALGADLVSDPSAW